MQVIGRGNQQRKWDQREIEEEGKENTIFDMWGKKSIIGTSTKLTIE